MLDRFSISRFSIGYQPMFAIFVADGIARASRRSASGCSPPRWWSRSSSTRFPALTPVRNEVAPSILAAQAAAQRIDPEREQLFVGHTMTVFRRPRRSRFAVHARPRRSRDAAVSARERSWLLAEVTTTPEEGIDVPPRARTPLEHRPAPLLRDQARAAAPRVRGSSPAGTRPSRWTRTSGAGCADTP